MYSSSIHSHNEVSTVHQVQLSWASWEVRATSKRGAQRTGVHPQGTGVNGGSEAEPRAPPVGLASSTTPQQEPRQGVNVSPSLTFSPHSSQGHTSSAQAAVTISHAPRPCHKPLERRLATTGTPLKPHVVLSAATPLPQMRRERGHPGGAPWGGNWLRPPGVKEHPPDPGPGAGGTEGSGGDGHATGAGCHNQCGVHASESPGRTIHASESIRHTNDIVQ